jgi:hypothetical protein
LARSTTHFSVFYDPSTGASGRTSAERVVAEAEADYATLVEWFAMAATDAPQHFNVILAPLSSGLDGTGGALPRVVQVGGPRPVPEVDRARSADGLGEHIDIREASAHRTIDVSPRRGSAMTRSASLAVPSARG